ncbi:DUF2334 domain-containing protein [candidate division KSB1 bacterium]|nr:DUF2334 domain-containing protein [candidate division KSB1 bacterium]
MFNINLKSPLMILSFIIIVEISGVHSALAAESYLNLDPVPNQINAVRFDPSYYYDSPLKIDKMAEELVLKWKSSNVNTVFYKAYDPIYGAKYKTSYSLNVMADYGRFDLLKHILKTAKQNEIRVIAWIPAFLHKSAWDQHPEWRVKSADGSDYHPTEDSYFLCPANPQVREWWLGFIKDILNNYKDLDGVDIAEPIINWSGHQCFCGYCSKHRENELSTSEGLTRTLNETVELVQSIDKKVCITTVASVHDNGRIFSAREQISKTGFDLEGVLNNKTKPDWINIELMWQQWADYFQNRRVFKPEWLTDAVHEVLRQVNERATVIGHLEITSFGESKVDADLLAQSIRIVKEAGIEHIDIYDTHLLDSQNAWETIQSSLTYVPTKNIIVYSDPRGENDAKQIASLLSHFKTKVRIVLFDDNYQMSPFELDSINALFYIGVDPKFTIPPDILKAINKFDGTLCWVNYGIEQLLDIAGEDRFGFEYEKPLQDSLYTQVSFKGYSLPRIDPSYHKINITDSTKCVELASMTNGTSQLPYTVRSGNLWYFADLPTSFVTEGGRHIVISDLLHDIVREDHMAKKLALIRVEDINPFTNIESLKRVVGYLKSQNVPFSVALVPFYLDPESNTAATLTDRPDFVKEIKKIQNSGGTIIMHGTTHQYRGETTADYEFWDSMTSKPLFADSKEYVRQKLFTGFDELKKNGIYPLSWETPHYAASQLDYPIMNSFFSTAYERRQTIDLHGTDQLLPYMIYNHTSGGQIIPENLGYIPLSRPDAGPMLQAAKNNLAIRDGVASFFFHTFVDHSALKDIIPGLKKLGYQFTSPRYTDNFVTAPGFRVVSGENEINLDLNDEYLHEFYYDEKGHIRDETYSDSTINGSIQKQIVTPAGWVYVAEKVDNLPQGFFAQTFNSIIPSVPKLTSTIFNPDEKSLMDADATPIRAAVLVDSTVTERAGRDQYNFIHAIESVGIDVKSIDIKNLIEVPEGVNLLIVPQTAARNLNSQQNLFLIYALQNGLNLILEKNSELSQNIGIIPGEEVAITDQVIDEYFPQVNINWKKPDTVRAFDLDIEYVSYYNDKKSELPVVIGGEYGTGKYLYFATLFDPNTEYGFGRFPYFIDLLNRQFNLVPTVRRNTVEIYFEPGDREDISIEDLVKIWRNNGVRRIYVSAWHFYEAYTYDYERLIRLAHQNAMLVYAWTELPHVSEKFWLEHPEWREKTATGRDARVDWRSNMALDIPECKQAVFDELRKILTSYDWDGINFAELYYESPKGYEQPENFTPLNEYMRNLFRTEYGFDPLSLFNPNTPYYWKRNPTAVNKFFDFREEHIVKLHDEFLNFLYQLKEQNDLDWEIIVTSVDNIFSPEVGKGTGVNTFRILELADEYPFTIQIEDPLPLWALGPDRYTKLIDAYSSVKEKYPFILDINVVPIRDMKITQAPTAQPTGLELYSLAKAAGNGNTRVAMYSEASLYEVDFPIIPYIMAIEAKENITDEGWEINTPYTVNTLLDYKAHKDVIVNGELWPAYYQGRVILPPGKHLIQPVSRTSRFIKRFKSNTRLVDISGELLSTKIISRGIEIKYQSLVPNVIILSEEPTEIILDDKNYDTQVTRGELGYAVRLPAGQHITTIYTLSSGTQTLKYASTAISGLIVFLGISAGLLLSGLYLRSSIRRKHLSI